MQGLDDEYGIVRQLHDIAQVAPHAQTSTFPGCGHSPHRDTPDAAIKAIQAFVQRPDLSPAHCPVWGIALPAHASAQSELSASLLGSHGFNRPILGAQRDTSAPPERLCPIKSPPDSIQRKDHKTPPFTKDFTLVPLR